MRALPVLLLLAACSSGVKRPTSADVLISGTVYLGGLERRGDVVENAVVTVRSGNQQLASVVTSSTGTYSLKFTAASGTPVLLSFTFPGLVPTYRTLTVGPFTELVFPVALDPPEPVECSDTRCLTESGEVSVAEVPDGLAGLARAFEPVSELPRLSGLETLRPLAAAWVSLDAGPVMDGGPTLADGGVIDGGEIFEDGGEKFDAGPPVMFGNPQLRLRVPFGAWRKLEDGKPATDRLELNWLTFSEDAGTWNKAADGWLETEVGELIPETSLSAVRAGTFAGGVVAVGRIPSPGYWALALPAASFGCLSGTVEVDGQSAEGAVIFVEGANPVAAGPKGAFCLSSATGAGSNARTRVHYAGTSYSSTPMALPTGAAMCGGSCTNAGTLKIAGDQLSSLKPCKFSGRTLDVSGQPIPGAVVVGLDEQVPGKDFNNSCGKLGTRCTLSTTSDGDGRFTLNIPVLDEMSLAANAVAERPGITESTRTGTLRVKGCPTENVAFTLNDGRDKVEVAVTLAGNTVSWTPAKPAFAVRGTTVDGDLKWEVMSISGIASPMSWGQVPAGAKQTFPVSGSPAALLPGDSVEISLQGTGTDGYQYLGAGSGSVP